MSNIESIRPIGRHQTYDLEVEHPDHQFYLSNGILTSNSHAVAYAIDSYWCAWLLTHHETEWLCAYMESQVGNPKGRAQAIGELKRFGYRVGRIDVNESGSSWTIGSDGRSFFPSFTTAKGVGEAAIAEIAALRPFGPDPKANFYDSEGNWRLSKFNRCVLEALIRLRAFESTKMVGPGCFFSSYRHMHRVLIENDDKIRRHLKKRPWAGWEAMQELAASEECPEWERHELVAAEAELIGSFDPASLMSDELIKKLADAEIRPVNEWDVKDVYWFVVGKSAPRKTKRGSPYLMFEAVGQGGDGERMFVWNWDGVTSYPNGTLLVGEIDKSDFGLATKQRSLKQLEM